MPLSRQHLVWAGSAMVSMVLSLAGAATLSAGAETNDPSSEHKWQAEYADQLPSKSKAKKRPLISLAKGVGKELGASVDAMAKDMVFVFSVQDIDPYENNPPKNRPYELLGIRLIDGSRASVIKYPDGSGKINGGFADGTVIIPVSSTEYLVKYPNGARARLEKFGSTTIKVYRPDNTVTTFKKGASGGYSISNDQLGYMGEATPDRTGLRYEF